MRKSWFLAAVAAVQFSSFATAQLAPRDDECTPSTIVLTITVTAGAPESIGTSDIGYTIPPSETLDRGTVLSLPATPLPSPTHTALETPGKSQSDLSRGDSTVSGHVAPAFQTTLLAPITSSWAPALPSPVLSPLSAMSSSASESSSSIPGSGHTFVPLSFLPPTNTSLAPGSNYTGTQLSYTRSTPSTSSGSSGSSGFSLAFPTATAASNADVASSPATLAASSITTTSLSLAGTVSTLSNSEPMLHSAAIGTRLHTSSSSVADAATLPNPTALSSVIESSSPVAWHSTTTTPHSSSSLAMVSTSFTTSILTGNSRTHAQSPTSAVALPTVAPASTSSNPKILRGVNLGGWLVMEKWMCSGQADQTDDSCPFTGAFSSALDQWTFDDTKGVDVEAALQKHWSTYITEDDFKALASAGINAVRIPIGYWAFHNDTSVPYKQGADVWLDKAIGWARDNNVKVWVDCHGSPGSQNGYEHSGRTGAVEWQSDDNLELSITVLETMATRYGAQSYADVVVGLELTNEPLPNGVNVFSKTKAWTQKAYAAVREAAANKELMVVMHDAFMTPLAWMDLAEEIISGSAKTFGIDTHLYQLYTPADLMLDQSQHIAKACSWGADLAIANAVMPTYVGEFTAVTEVCSATGTDCTSEDDMEQMRKFVEAQLDTFEANTSGYFMWSAKAPGNWGFLNGIKSGAIPNPITDRKYPNQCLGGLKRRGLKRHGSRNRQAEMHAI